MTSTTDSPRNPNISRPHRHKKGYRCEIRTPSGAWRHGPTRSTEEDAILYAAQALALLDDERSQTVGACIDAYLDDHRDRGTRTRTIATYRQHLVRFFGPALDKPLGWVTAARAASLYERRRTATGERTGKPLAADTHRGALGVSRHFLGWCVGSKKWLRVNPLAQVKGIGTLRRGKAQPTIDEARTLWAVCLREAEAGDAGALAAALALSMGLRAGEICSLVVRSLDDTGADGLPQRLRIADNEAIGFQTKTKSSRRPVLIPEELRTLLVVQARDKLPSALLFPSTVGRANWTVWVNRAVHRMCKVAGIPEVCAHALRGASATVAASAGETPQLVARMLGHTNASITAAHYIAPGTAEAALAAQGLKVLRGGKGGK